MTVLIIVFITAILALYAGAFNQSKFSRYIGILGLLIAFSVSYMPECSFFEKYYNMFQYDVPSRMFTQISLLVTLLIFFLGGFAFSNHRSHQSELYSLMLFSLCGALVMFGFKNLVTLFIGIEILSIPLYVMAGSSKSDLRSVEASMKYFLTGAFATGFLLFGIAMVYGSAGSFDLVAIYQYGMASGNNPMFTLGFILMLCAMAFKASLAPFHMWSPDVYQGSPSLIMAFMATVVKIAAFVALFKMMIVGFAGTYSNWANIMAAFVIISLLLANIMGLAQTNFKRMLAYSSVSHAGYIALVFFGMNESSLDNMAFYLLAYSLATIGVFTTLIWVEKVKKDTSYEAFRGLAKSEPLLAVVATVSLVSMAGIPLTAGFVGKFSLFTQAMAGQPILVVIAIIGSAISIAYYLRPIIAMFFYKDSTFKTGEKVSLTYNILAIVIVIAIIALGVYPDLFTNQFR
ncbi:NADH-quinone oxidoreductase subunit N [Elizabethkingia sp. JS20170427COW]|uniref:NADH-quinone oxidoreductase subunit N n=1 Tax=Elizabethkingia sp. JS20170427COW TaxID=2583851 RepID=UPI001110689D|nr:NADH-quinone oxidoreductase subunit N [Elizabethkingia sp. JS20170427COW]QCX52644.1 NADH-quinone oxidoreductase subunit N [Elizabethkingia sp. JS20170427COW]